MWIQGFVFFYYVVVLVVLVWVLLCFWLELMVWLLWILVIELVLLVGIFVYILFGEICLCGVDCEIMINVCLCLLGLWKFSFEVLCNVFDFVVLIIVVNCVIMGFVVVVGNCVILLVEDDSVMVDLVVVLDDVCDYVYLLFYIWLDDVLGCVVVDVVICVVGWGVKVCVVIDVFGLCVFVWFESWQCMKDVGVECVEVLLLGWFIIGSLVYCKDLCNYCKIVVIDYVMGFIGSCNCLDMVFVVKLCFVLWVDILLCIEGLVVCQMQVVFLQDWMSYIGEDLGDMLCMIGFVSVFGEIVQVVVIGFDDWQGLLLDCMVMMIYVVWDKLVIIMFYYVFDVLLDSVICMVVWCGVDVIMVLFVCNDLLIVQVMFEGFYYGFVFVGVKLMLFQDGFLYVKIIIVDGCMIMVGSVNMDCCSFELNYEMNMLFLGGDLIEVLDVCQQIYIVCVELIIIGEICVWLLWWWLCNNLLVLVVFIL